MTKRELLEVLATVPDDTPIMTVDELNITATVQDGVVFIGDVSPERQDDDLELAQEYASSLRVALSRSRPDPKWTVHYARLAARHGLRYLESRDGAITS